MLFSFAACELTWSPRWTQILSLSHFEMSHKGSNSFFFLSSQHPLQMMKWVNNLEMINKGWKLKDRCSEEPTDVLLKNQICRFEQQYTYCIHSLYSVIQFHGSKYAEKNVEYRDEVKCRCSEAWDTRRRLIYTSIYTDIQSTYTKMGLG